MEYINRVLFLKINLLNQTHQSLNSLIILIGEYIPYLFIAYIVYIYFYKKNKLVALYSFYSCIFALFFSFIISLVYYHNRPFADHIGHTLITHKADSSFPSDHTVFMSSIASILLFDKKSMLVGIIALIIASISGVCRIYIGVHYPLDILSGILLGIFSSTIIFYIKGIFTPLNNFVLTIEKLIFKRS